MAIRIHSFVQILNIRSPALSSRFASFLARAALVSCAGLAVALASLPTAGPASAGGVAGLPPNPPTPAASGGWSVCGAVIPDHNGKCVGDSFSTSAGTVPVNKDFGKLGVSFTARGGDSPSVSMTSWANSPNDDDTDWGWSGITAGDDYYFAVVSSVSSVKIDCSWTASHNCGASGGGSYDCNGGLKIADVAGDVIGANQYQFQDPPNGYTQDTLTGTHHITLTVLSNTWLRVNMWLDASTFGAGNPHANPSGPGSAAITESIDPTIKIDPYWLSDPNNDPYAYVGFSTLSLPATPEPATTTLVVLGTGAIAALRRRRSG